jgi:hypothetical protein
MSEIVNRLRNYASSEPKHRIDNREAMNAAADRIEALETAMRAALHAPMIDHGDSRRSTYGILREALGDGEKR